MSNRVTKPVKVGGITVTVREITLKEIRAWVKDVADSTDPREHVDINLFDRQFFVFDLYYLSDLTAEQADDLTPVELREISDAAKEINADFFAYRARLYGQALSVAPAQPQS